MSTIIQKATRALSWTPILQFQRFRGKINIQRPRKPHYERARALAVTQPRFSEETKAATCFHPNPKLPPKIYNPYNDIIAREVLNWLNSSRMVAFFHINSITQEDLFSTKVALYHNNMHLKSYGKKIITQAVNGTRYEAILPLFESQQYIIFSPDQNVKQLLKIVRKTPQLILLAGIVDDRLLSRNDFVAYAQLPGLQTARAELVNTLNMSANKVVHQLESHQINLATILDVYEKS